MSGLQKSKTTHKGGLWVIHLAALHEDNNKTDGGPEDAAQHGCGSAHCVNARLYVPCGQPLHQQQSAGCSKGCPHLQQKAVKCKRALCMYELSNIIQVVGYCDKDLGID